MVADDGNFPPLGSRSQRRRNKQTYSQATARRGSVIGNREDARSTPGTGQTEGINGREQLKDPTNKVKVQTTTVLPKEIRGGELEGNVRLQLRYDGVSPSMYGVTRCINRPDGGIIITIPDNKKRLELEAALRALDYKIVEQAYKPFEVRIHGLPEDTGPHIVEEEVQRRFGITPIRIETFSYSRENNKLKNLLFVVVYCNEELYKLSLIHISEPTRPY